MKIDKKTLDSVIETLLFEDMSYGVYDRPGPTGETDPNFKPTVEPSVPLKPTEMMSAQLATERPPIEDEDYAPASVSDLRQAASAVAELVPPDHVEKFYKRIKDLLTQLEDEKAAEEVPRSKQVATEEEEEMPVKSPKPSLNKESRARRLKRIVESINELAQRIERIKKNKRLTEGKKGPVARRSATSLTLEALLREVESGSGMPPVTRVPMGVSGRPQRTRVSKLASLELDEPMPEDTVGSPDVDEEAKLRQIAAELGISVSEVRNILNRAIKKSALIARLNPEDVDFLEKRIFGRFLNVTPEVININEEDMALLQMFHEEKINSLDGTIFHEAFQKFIGGLYDDAYSEELKPTEKSMISLLKRSGLGDPGASDPNVRLASSTIRNIVMDLSKGSEKAKGAQSELGLTKGESNIRKTLQEIGKSEEEIQEYIKKFRSLEPQLKAQFLKIGVKSKQGETESELLSKPPEGIIDYVYDEYKKLRPDEFKEKVRESYEGLI